MRVASTTPMRVTLRTLMRVTSATLMQVTQTTSNGTESRISLPGQVSPRQLASFKHGPKILPLKFGENQISNS